MQNLNLHVIANQDFQFSIDETEKGPIVNISVGPFRTLIFFHDGKEAQAFADIENAIRAYQMSKEVAS